MMTIETEIQIDASPAQVWKTLTDLDAYHEWNPFIVSSLGKAEKGARLINTLQMEGQKPQRFKPVVLKADKNQEFRWLGRFLMPKLFDGEHYFRLSPTQNGGTRLVHGERFSGLLVKIFMSSIKDKVISGFTAMNEALKARSEAATR